MDPRYAFTVATALTLLWSLFNWSKPLEKDVVDIIYYTIGIATISVLYFANYGDTERHLIENAIYQTHVMEAFCDENIENVDLSFQAPDTIPDEVKRSVDSDIKTLIDNYNQTADEFCRVLGENHHMIFEPVKRNSEKYSPPTITIFNKTILSSESTAEPGRNNWLPYYAFNGEYYFEDRPFDFVTTEQLETVTQVVKSFLETKSEVTLQRANWALISYKHALDNHIHELVTNAYIKLRGQVLKRRKNLIKEIERREQVKKTSPGFLSAVNVFMSLAWPFFAVGLLGLKISRKNIYQLLKKKPASTNDADNHSRIKCRLRSYPSPHFNRARSGTGSR